ncbi:ABC transporter permease [Kroppenstedtia pulmonis]|uniref:ABC transporter permease n=1 Tax=Kroppenstedtia pulmonis TaxID=1380685 RepID=A0A7D3XKB9_9BACL|nr:ABC transporter permease [Kroppenstedtia pulmonis]QKG85459.1 ABC transporter permease [Kroppenstedtia pulmonis]
MKAYGRLTWAQLLLFFRNKNTIIWSLLLPVFMMLALGTLMGQSGSTQFSLNAVVADQDGTSLSKDMVEAFRQTEGLKVTVSDPKSALNQVKSGEADLAILLKKGMADRFNKKSGVEKSDQVILYLDKSNPTVAEIGSTLVTDAVDKVNRKQMDYHPLVTAKEVNVQSRSLGYIDFLVPGVLSLMIMSNNLNAVAATIASWRERGILRRMQGTPLSSSTFIAGQITARLLLNGIQALVVLLVAYFVFDVHIYGSWWLLLFFLFLGILTFMSIGFIIANLAKNPESASPIAGLVSFPMIFVGGIFFPIRDLPGLLQPIVKLIPIGYLTDSLRGVMNQGAGLGELWIPAAVLTGWMIVSFTVAAFTFRWDD